MAEAKKEQSDSSKTLGKLSKKLEKQSEDAVNLERKVENAALTIADYEQRLASKNLEMDDLADKATSNDKRFEKLSVEYTAIETEKATLLTNLTREMKEMRDQHQKGVADLKFEYEQKCDAVKRENDRLSMELEIYKRTHISTERLDQTLEMLAQQINKTATMASVTSASKPAENAPHIQIPAAAEPIEAQLIPISPPPKSKKPRVKSKPRKAIAENQTLETLAEVEEPEEMEAVVEEIESAAEPLEQTFSEKPEKARVKTKSRKAVGGSSSQNLESLDEVGEPEEMEEIVDCLPQKAKKSLAKSTSKKVAVESGKEDLEFLAKVDEPEEPEAVFENADEPSTVKDTDKPSKSMKIVPKSKKSKSKSNVISLPILDPPRLNDLPEGPFNEETETAKLHSNAVRSKSKKSSAARNESDAGKSKRGKKVISERIEEQSEPDSPLEEGTVSPAEINSRKKKLPLAPSDKGNNINSTEPNKRRKIDANAAPTVEPVKMAFKGLAGSIFKKDRVPIESIGEGTELVPRIPQRYVDKRRLEMLQEED